MNPVLTVAEFAARYGVSTSTVWWWISEGKAPPSYKLARRRVFDLEAVILWEMQKKAATAR